MTKRSGTSEIPVARVGPGSLQGEIAALEGGRRLASVQAATDAEVLRIPIGAVRELLGAGPDVALAIIRTAVSRLREMESTLREREKLAALGTLSAGLAHELNNPAAAAARAVHRLGEAIDAAEKLTHPDARASPAGGRRPAAIVARARRSHRRGGRAHRRSGPGRGARRRRVDRIGPARAAAGDARRGWRPARRPISCSTR